MYGWTGKLLRLDMTNHVATIEDNKYAKDYLGGMALANRVMYDEVPHGTHPQDAKSKIVLAAGTLAGTGVPCSGRTTVALMSPFGHMPLIADAHMGGSFAPKLKFAGYDAVIVEGQSATPVWVSIKDDKITFEDASDVWGKGTKETTKILNEKTSREACVCCIGPAGENLINNAIIVNSMCHAAGCGAGSVFGSKKLKAIVVEGTKSVKIADPMKMLELQHYQNADLIGANNNHVQPANQQSWNEFVAPTRWQGGPGKEWGEAIGGPLDTGEQKPGDIGAIGLRNNTINYFIGMEDVVLKHTVKNTGCHSCPIRCYPAVKVDALKPYGTQYNQATCMTMVRAKDWWGADNIQNFDPTLPLGECTLALDSHMEWMMDDLGIWCGYGDLDYVFSYCMKNDVFKSVLSEDEYKSIPWDKRTAGDPTFINDILHRIAYKEGEFGRVMGMGSLHTALEWKLPDSFWHEATGIYFMFKKGFIRHHSSESLGQVGALINVCFNRDPMCHTHQNCLGNGLPYDIRKAILEEKFGEGCADNTADYKEMNMSKAKFAKWAVVRDNLHDTLALCNWVWPMIFSPLKERGYKGDLALESMVMEAATGEAYTEDSLDMYAEKAMHLQRAMTALAMNTKSLRKDHDDCVSNWVFDRDPDAKPFTQGTTKLEREDWQKALDMFYEAWGWDVATGIPTRATLEATGLKDVADDLEKAGLLPA